MRSTRFAFSLIAIVLTAVLAAGCADPMSEELHQRSRNQPEWFQDAKLGIFIHWGLPSVPAYAPGAQFAPGELEKILLSESTRAELPYSEWYLNSLNYVGGKTETYHREHYGNAPYSDFQAVFEASIAKTWDPEAWAEFFYNTGAKYVVLVTKHHDGYTLWPSEVENPNHPGWGSSRDLVGELAEAVRARGMRFGTYYSTGLDWSFQMVTEGNWAMDVIRSAPSSQEYADYVYAHMEELINRYHPDILWADIGYPSKGRQGDLFEYYFDQVPQGAVNDRWEPIDILGDFARWPGGTWVLQKLGRWAIENKPSDLVDDPDRYGYKTTEYSNLEDIAPFTWESTRGLGGSFGHNKHETADDMLSSAQLIDYLIDTVSKNGNVLINVGPDSSGLIPQIQQRPLAGLGDWLSVNGEAIYGTRPWRRFNNSMGRDLRYTQKDKVLYAIVLGSVGKAFSIEHPGVEFISAQVLGGELLEIHKGTDTLDIQLAQAIEAPAVVVRYTLR